MIGVSSCLAGINCTFKGQNHLIKRIQKMVVSKEAVMFCPEVLGGMSTPREPCEIINGKVISCSGVDHTKEYYDGAYRALNLLQKLQVNVVLLKSKSPSCGKGKVYDGTFQHVLVNGNGITVKVLEENGIIVYNEDKIEEFFKYIEKR
ncbi:MAG: DUF523 domain-containing protein [Coprobacillaceae bacterium]